ncbi:WhiB family transcription factor [Mycobacterium phage Halena]|uniref:WhiB family transcription factor n=2 Tax=Bronvirus TaxID=1623278 RepID=A0A482JAV9_9CAUD|nr:WhiB transcriptional factor [Mycobacterium phage Silverleaf]AEZ50755.1 hypothetical protein [Mycobacterium phage Fezzik]QBP29858.1 WhiB family transcription factor [Mycobacterium phage Halena]QOC56742.1 WhiB family transcription factor [Mycobacterium phage Tyson]UEM46361.1 WhiB family transcription factor [Mycobacterium phage Enceladus]WMI34672.1 WhiB family transcription factor [Mycobacterium phage Calm]
MNWWAQNWRKLADCQYVDPELFFPLKGQNNAWAKRICAGCPVREECLEDAMAAEYREQKENRHGIRAGLTPTARYQLAKERGEFIRTNDDDLMEVA